MKGYRTVAVNTGIAAGTAALNVLAGVDWVSLVGPHWAVAAVAIANIGLRIITTTPVRKA